MCVLKIFSILKKKKLTKLRRKHHFGFYILRSQSIWSLHFGSSQYGPYYFKFGVKLIPTVNSLTENVYVTNGVHNWHI